MLPFNRISLGVLGQFIGGHESTVLDFVARYTPPVFLVMDNDPLCVQLCDLSLDTLVIHRRYDGGDYLWWYPGSTHYKSPAEAVDHATNYGQVDKRVAVQILNEPAAYGADIDTLCQWLIDVGHILTERGYRGVLWNVGAAIYPPEVIESGRFDAFLRYMAQEAQKPRGHLLGYHEYTFGFLPFGAGLYTIDELRQPEKLQPPWKTIGDMNAFAAYGMSVAYTARTGPDIVWPYSYEDRENKPYANWWLFEGDKAQTVYPGWWHILRYRWFELYAESKGIGKAQIVISEGLHDRMPDLGPSGIIEELEAKYGIPLNAKGQPYQGLRGPCTLENLWRDWWPHWTFEQAAYEQFVWMNDAYPENVLGVTLFGNAWGNNEWPEKHGYGLIQKQALLELMIAHKDDGTEPPPDDEEPAGDAVGCLLAVVSIASGLALGVRLLGHLVNSIGVQAMNDSNIPAIFRSKRFWSAITALIMMVVVALVPTLEAYADTLQPAIVILFGLLIGGYAAEDIQEAKAKRS